MNEVDIPKYYADVDPIDIDASELKTDLNKGKDLCGKNPDIECFIDSQFPEEPKLVIMTADGPLDFSEALKIAYQLTPIDNNCDFFPADYILELTGRHEMPIVDEGGKRYVAFKSDQIEPKTCLVPLNEVRQIINNLPTGNEASNNEVNNNPIIETQAANKDSNVAPSDLAEQEELNNQVNKKDSESDYLYWIICSSPILFGLGFLYWASNRGERINRNQVKNFEKHMEHRSKFDFSKIDEDLRSKAKIISLLYYIFNTFFPKLHTGDHEVAKATVINFRNAVDLKEMFPDDKEIDKDASEMFPRFRWIIKRFNLFTRHFPDYPEDEE